MAETDERTTTKNGERRRKAKENGKKLRWNATAGEKTRRHVQKRAPSPKNDGHGSARRAVRAAQREPPHDHPPVLSAHPPTTCVRTPPRTIALLRSTAAKLRLGVPRDSRSGLRCPDGAAFPGVPGPLRPLGGRRTSRPRSTGGPSRCVSRRWARVGLHARSLGQEVPGVPGTRRLRSSSSKAAYSAVPRSTGAPWPPSLAFAVPPSAAGLAYAPQ